MPVNQNNGPLPAGMDLARSRIGTDDGYWQHLSDTRWSPNLERITWAKCGHARLNESEIEYPAAGSRSTAAGA